MTKEPRGGLAEGARPVILAGPVAGDSKIESGFTNPGFANRGEYSTTRKVDDKDLGGLHLQCKDEGGEKSSGRQQTFADLSMLEGHSGV